MIAPQTRQEKTSKRERLTGTRTALSTKISAPVDEESNPARTLAGLYKRCGTGGGCPYTVGQIISVLEALRYHGTVVATDIANSVQMPASAVYGCVLELEDCGLTRWIPEPVLEADHITAEITLAGMRFLREIDRGGGRC